MKEAPAPLLAIRKYGDPVLQKKAKPVKDLAQVKDLAPAMFEAMYAEPGIGLAAPQVGISLRLMVVDVAGEKDKPRPMVLVNPKIEEKKGKIESVEGCLSFPGISVTIHRAERVRLSALNEHGFPVSVEADGLLSRCFQHEMDHLDGVLMIDHLSPVEKFKVQLEIRRLKKAGQW
jgi:peptide deformylase